MTGCDLTRHATDPGSRPHPSELLEAVAEADRMRAALTEIANRAGVDRGADWARNRAMEGLRDE